MARLGHRPVLRPAAAALFALLASCWFGMDWGGVHPTLFADDLLQFVLPGAAAVSCAVAAVRDRDRRRLTWWLVAAFCGFEAAGNLIWFVIEAVMGHTVPFPSLADIGFLAAIPFAFAAVLSWRGPWAKLRSLSVLQGLVLGGSLLIVSWAFVLRPLVASSGLDPLGDALDIVYPLTDVLLLSLIAFALLYRMRPVPRGLLLLGLGFAAITVSDSTFTYMTLKGTFGVTNWIDAGWLLGYAWIGCAPFWPASEAEAVPEPARNSLLLMVVPYVGLAGAITGAVYELLSNVGVDPVLIALAFVVVLLLLTLQLVALLESRSWARELTRVDDQRRSLLTHLVKAQEEERHRIAADLHDDVVQVMTAINLRLEVLRRRGGPDGDGNVEALQQLTSQSIRRLRELLFELHPPALEQYGLAAALRAQLDQFTESTGVAAHLGTEITQEPETNARTVLFRIAQEALQNVRKHAEAGRVVVELRTVSGGTQVRLRDDGRGLPPGFSSAPPPGHLGLTVMDERARLAGGWWRIARADGGGTAVEFWVPGLLPPPPTSALDPGPDVRSREPRDGHRQ